MDGNDDMISGEGTRDQAISIEEKPATDALRLRDFKAGTLIRNKGSGQVYTVVRSSFGHDGAAIAVRTVEVNNPPEWEIVRNPAEPG